MITVTPHKFKAMRKKLRLSQTEIAGMFGVEYHTVCRWENAKHGIPGSAKVLIWLLYDEQINKNKNAVRDYADSTNDRS